MPTLAHRSESSGALRDAVPTGRIGPNAVTRLAEALDEALGELATHEIFRAAGQLQLRHEPPVAMVDERVVTALHASLRRSLAPPDAARISGRAGEFTANYLLAHRIPSPARLLLPLLPAPLAARLLVSAMARHAWTFAGSGEFSADFRPQTAVAGESAPRLRLTIAGCPLCRGAHSPDPVCDYFSATFERLFRALVSRTATVRESSCRAHGTTSCVFDVQW